MNIIFDLDGTLIDSSVGILSAIKNAFSICDVNLEEKLDVKLIGPPLNKLLPFLAKTDNSETIGMLTAAFMADYDSDGYKKTEVFSGIHQALVKLKGEGHTLYLATNKRIIPTKKIIEYFGWNGLFSGVYALDMYSHTNTKQELIEYVITRHYLDKNKTLYVGDTISDSLATQANSLKYLMVMWGYDSDGFKGNNKVSTIEEMSEYISGIN